MAGDPQNIYKQYVSFEFFDSAGLVPTVFGNILYFTNDEILGIIREGEKTSTEIEKTRGGKAASGVVTLPHSFGFSITHKYHKDTWGKTRELINAIKLNYRIRFKLYEGYLLWDQGFHTFNNYAPSAAHTIFESAVVDIGTDPNYRNIHRGYGLATTPFPIVVYEGDQLPVPTTASQTSGTGDGVLTESFIVGGIRIPVDVYIPTH